MVHWISLPAIYIQRSKLTFSKSRLTWLDWSFFHTFSLIEEAKNNIHVWCVTTAPEVSPQFFFPVGKLNNHQAVPQNLFEIHNIRQKRSQIKWKSCSVQSCRESWHKHGFRGQQVYWGGKLSVVTEALQQRMSLSGWK